MSAKAPLRAVTDAAFRRANCIMNNNLQVTWWDLRLECGHDAERRVRFPKQKPGEYSRGFGALHHPRPANEALPPPARVRCADCQHERPRSTMDLHVCSMPISHWRSE